MQWRSEYSHPLTLTQKNSEMVSLGSGIVVQKKQKKCATDIEEEFKGDGEYKKS